MPLSKWDTRPIRLAASSTEANESNRGRSGAPLAEPARAVDLREYERTVEAFAETFRERNSTVENARTILDSPQRAERERTPAMLVSDLERRGGMRGRTCARSDGLDARAARSDSASV